MPDQQIGVAVITNGASSLAKRVAATIYDELLDFERGDLLDQLEASCEPQHKRAGDWHAKFSENPITAKRLSAPIKSYVGNFSNEHWGTITVRVDDGELRMRFGDLPISLRATSKDAFVFAVTPEMSESAYFMVEGNESVTGIVVASGRFGEITFER